MDTKAAIIALLSVWGVGTCVTVPAIAQDAQDTEDAADDDGDRGNPLLNKVWVRSDADPSLPGPMQIFLADGTLVSDSCWETYRLSTWQQVSDSAISWNEDGMTINADIASLTESELVLSLKLGNDVTEQRFITADVPYVCPDMEK
ncbi:hypothetical protein [Devosia neptuniae]|jgi:hypothetical protein|uniref:hypothetical protein n=1 Tax=Devosia TaxID=46913 RepID=UPI0022AF0474|nr:hypothetical protein [Devosia neptuniae]MCZ4345824.1 hypothetical protein [Devosia neptuniae]|tara:strand:+ start:200 stop:637 length:438 start_codon:yes stop_codon:yes gene_type:complete